MLIAAIQKPAVLFWCIIAFCFSVNATAQNTLRLSPQNHHYVTYRQKPVLLITSGEHYGALLNLDFDYIAYLNALQKEGMNNTRVFSGAYVERKNDIKWMLYNNTLAPKENRLIAPWKRSNIPGYINGGNKFDLDQWDDQYFIRLKNLLRQAAMRSIVIELTLFGNQYNDSIYQYSPLYPDNNIQGKGPKGENSFLLFQSLADTALVARQEKMVVKLVQELNAFDNLYYEISNEPYNEVKDSAVVDKWNAHMAKLIRQTEMLLPKKHLIATNQSIVDNKAVDIANYHYVHISNMPGFDSLLRLNKVIGMDETMGSLIHADVNDVRVEAWDFILHGGGAYNNLSWEYTPSAPQGTSGADTIRQYLKHLQQFMSTFRFVHMQYSPGLLVLLPAEAITRVLAEEGKQYAVYIHHSTPHDMEPVTAAFVSKYEADTSSFKDSVALSLPAGKYTVQWYNPAKGNWYGNRRTLQHKGGVYTFHTPLFTTDIALSIVRK
ncbi:hypothetical protein FC093_19825 [Ilyomonas limi]|uniref:Glycoside hydrolase family 5 domain-containing protein n=1 Tax=Ilyomonas limi TaxID=2575867 RepID=A0A4U3KUU3_9BACT|nr:hypothetical protein [Ilyomonas limi]TKK65569.1 hypothetical protein FC093_19825 [Ilyomonas limi]